MGVIIYCVSAWHDETNIPIVLILSLLTTYHWNRNNLLISPDPAKNIKTISPVCPLKINISFRLAQNVIRAKMALHSTVWRGIKLEVPFRENLCSEAECLLLCMFYSSGNWKLSHRIVSLPKRVDRGPWSFVWKITRRRKVFYYINIYISSIYMNLCWCWQTFPTGSQFQNNVQQVLVESILTETSKVPNSSCRSICLRRPLRRHPPSRCFRWMRRALLARMRPLPESAIIGNVVPILRTVMALRCTAGVCSLCVHVCSWANDRVRATIIGEPVGSLFGPDEETRFSYNWTRTRPISLPAVPFTIPLFVVPFPPNTYVSHINNSLDAVPIPHSISFTAMLRPRFYQWSVCPTAYVVVRHPESI